jgi:hypothetical protein
MSDARRAIICRAILYRHWHNVVSEARYVPIDPTSICALATCLSLLTGHVSLWPIASMLACLPLSCCRGVSGHDQLGRIRLVAPRLLFRRWKCDASLSAADLARRRIYPSARPGRPNHGRESSAVAGVASHFHGSRFLLSHAAGRTKSCRNSAKHYSGQGRRQTGMEINPKSKAYLARCAELPVVCMRRILPRLEPFS